MEMSTTTPRATRLFAALDANADGILRGAEIPEWVATGCTGETFTADEFEKGVPTLVETDRIDGAVVRNEERHAAGLCSEAEAPPIGFVARFAHFCTGFCKLVLAVILTPFTPWFSLGRTILGATYVNAGQDLRTAVETQKGRISRETEDFRNEVKKEKLIRPRTPPVVMPMPKMVSGVRMSHVALVA